MAARCINTNRAATVPRTTGENMNTATEEQTALATLPPAARAAIALNATETEVKLHELAGVLDGIASVTNADGREESHRVVMTAMRARTTIDKAGDAAVADAKEFIKAVGAKKAELVEIIRPGEVRVRGLRDGWDEKIAAEKAEKIRVERARIAAIQARIQTVRDLPLRLIGTSAAQISVMISDLVASEPGEDFEEFLPEAQAARHDAIEKMAKAETAQRAIEIEAESQRQEAARKAAEAEAERIAEAARVAAERAELEQLRAAAAETARLAKIESDRVAAEQAAEANRLAAIAKQQRIEQAERERVAAEERAAAQRALDEQARAAAAELERQRAAIAAAEKALAEQKAAADARDAAARQAAEDAAHALTSYDEAHAMNAQIDAERLERDHAEALEMDEAISYERHEQAAFDAAGVADDCARIVINAAPADHAADVIAVTTILYDVADVVDCEFDPLHPCDEEIIEIGKCRGLDLPQWVERLRLFVAAHGGVEA